MLSSERFAAFVMGLLALAWIGFAALMAWCVYGELSATEASAGTRLSAELKEILCNQVGVWPATVGTFVVIVSPMLLVAFQVSRMGNADSEPASPPETAEPWLPRLPDAVARGVLGVLAVIGLTAGLLYRSGLMTGPLTLCVFGVAVLLAIGLQVHQGKTYAEE